MSRNKSLQRRGATVVQIVAMLALLGILIVMIIDSWPTTRVTRKVYHFKDGHIVLVSPLGTTDQVEPTHLYEREGYFSPGRPWLWSTEP